MPAEISQVGVVQVKLLPWKWSDLDWESLLDETKSECAIFRGEFGLAFDVCVNDDAFGIVASLGNEDARIQQLAYRAHRRICRAAHRCRLGADSLPRLIVDGRRCARFL
jgi:hypothetical protein